VAVTTRLATIHNYKDELSGFARERGQAKTSKTIKQLRPHSIPQEIQCAVFLTIKSLIRSGASLSHHNTCAHRLVSQPQQQEAHLTYTTGFLSYGSIRSNYLYLIKHSSVQQQKKATSAVVILNHNNEEVASSIPTMATFNNEKPVFLASSEDWELWNLQFQAQAVAGGLWSQVRGVTPFSH